ncbi:DUF5719 family protein [Arthrobacter oryzae]|uniref:DUF5719 family protein n=1 Tax=Arthrobacter oryzae TaxID=409290 RepID=UPI00160640E7|nr:DUF5719 family protein [Arthrobacter oryzae]
MYKEVKSDAGKRPGRVSRSVPGPRTAGRILSAAVLLAAAGTLVTGASLLVPGTTSRPLEAPLVAVPAGQSISVCPGPARLLEGTPVGTDPQFSPESATAATSLNAVVLSSDSGVVPASRLAPLGGSPLTEIAPEPAADATEPATGTPVLRAGVVAGLGVSDVSALSAEPLDNRQPAAGAVVSYAAADGDLRGSAAASCQRPGNDLWLVGANTALGRSAILNLSNPSSTPATVSLELFGAAGQIQAPGSRGLLVGPGTSRAIILGGLAPGQERLSVRVQSDGGPVAAHIQQSVLRGLTPGGVDFITPGAAPAIRQVITGLEVQDPQALAGLTSGPGYADAAPALQLTVPGTADAVVEINLYGRDGRRALPGGGVITVKAGSVTEVSLQGVPAGLYTVAASSDVSFAAAARSTRGLSADDAIDIAWSPAAARLGSQHVVPVPATGDRRLVFGAPEGRTTISYTPITADGVIGAAAAVDIAGGTTTFVQVPGDVGGSPVVGYLVSAAGDPAYGAVLLLQDGTQEISILTVAPEAGGQEQIPVTLGY